MGGSIGTPAAGAGSVSVFFEGSFNDTAAAVDVEGTVGPQVQYDIAAGVTVAPFADSISDLGGSSDRYTLGFIVGGITIAVPDNPWDTSISIDVFSGADIGLGIGKGYTWLFGEDEKPCP